jgi:metal-dependent amidase/aminoacylase/carboxypeptidase family protein
MLENDQCGPQRRQLHAYPELGFEEARTSAFIVDKLRRAGVDEVHAGLAGTRVVGVLRAGSGGHAIALRAANGLIFDLAGGGQDACLRP